MKKIIVTASAILLFNAAKAQQTNSGITLTDGGASPNTAQVTACGATQCNLHTFTYSGGTPTNTYTYPSLPSRSDSYQFLDLTWFANSAVTFYFHVPLSDFNSQSTNLYVQPYAELEVVQTAPNTYTFRFYGLGQ